MKIYIKSILIMIVGALVFSCEDLNEEPIGLLIPEGFYQTPADVEYGLNGAYSAIASEEFWGRKLTLSLLLRGDLADIGDPTTSSRRIQVNEFQMDATNGMVEAFWPRAYEALATANSAIEGAKQIDADQETKDALTAEGYFIRAFIHYHLVRLFADIPYMNFLITDPDNAYGLDETPVDQVYEGIINDLNFAKDNLPDIPEFRSRPGKGTAAGLLASVYLTRGMYQEAYDEAKYVIDNKDAFGYGLTPEFQNLFDATVIDEPTNAQELLFAIDFRGQDESSRSGAGNYTRDYMAPITGIRGDERFDNGEGWSVAVPTLEVYTSWDHRDYRRAVSFDTVTIMGDTLTNYQYWDQASRGVARPHIAKYFRAFGQASLNGRDSDHNYAALRYAEILLIAAEALNEVNNGPNTEAESYINEIRARARRELDGEPANDNSFPANVTPGLSKDQFLDLVLEERRFELAFEYKRWYDIKRRQFGAEAFASDGLEPQPDFDPDKDYLFPKPQSDLNLNPNLDQNDGY